MAVKLTGKPTNLTEYPNSFERQGAFPLDATELFTSLDAAKEYAKNNKIAYVGQTIKVVSGSDVKDYIIKDESGTLYNAEDDYTTSITQLSDDISDLQGKAVVADDVIILDGMGVPEESPGTWNGELTDKWFGSDS